MEKGPCGGSPAGVPWRWSPGGYPGRCPEDGVPCWVTLLGCPWRMSSGGSPQVRISWRSSSEGGPLEVSRELCTMEVSTGWGTLNGFS